MSQVFRKRFAINQNVVKKDNDEFVQGWNMLFMGAWKDDGVLHKPKGMTWNSVVVMSSKSGFAYVFLLHQDLMISL